VAREIEARIEEEQTLTPLFRARLPALLQEIETDAQNPFWIPLWGESVNFDEAARAIIVPPALLDWLVQNLGTPTRDQKRIHAGLEHSYGYLFSTLPTPYGYKRARWVDGEIDSALNLPGPLLNPGLHPESGLLSRLTWALAAVSLKDHPGYRALLQAPPPSIPAPWVGWAKREALRLRVRRLVETVALADSRTVRLRTDFVATDTGAVLIYSVDDSLVPGGPRLITAFPVKHSFVQAVLDPARLGDGQPIVSRYNASVPGLSPADEKTIGSRKVISLGSN
jgi:hypothetical protein